MGQNGIADVNPGHNLDKAYEHEHLNVEALVILPSMPAENTNFLATLDLKRSQGCSHGQAYGDAPGADVQNGREPIGARATNRKPM